MMAPEKVSEGMQRSRRNLIKLGAITGAVVLASLTTPRVVAAGNGQGGNGQGGNGQGGNGQGGNGQGGNGQNYCFLKGTNILTAKGGRMVEDLSPGDLVPTVFGGICPIKRIGHYLLKSGDRPKTRKTMLPVRIVRSALALDIPCADLFVTREHALLIDGVLVTAGSLINGTTITVYDPHELAELEFFHIELERHNVIYAEGAPCETLRRVEALAIDSAGHSPSQAAPCAPLLSCTGARREIKSRFRSAISPWIDRRQQLDIIRDELEERGIAILRDRNAPRGCGVVAQHRLARFIS